MIAAAAAVALAAYQGYSQKRANDRVKSDMARAKKSDEEYRKAKKKRTKMMMQGGYGGPDGYGPVSNWDEPKGTNWLPLAGIGLLAFVMLRK